MTNFSKIQNFKKNWKIKKINEKSFKNFTIPKNKKKSKKVNKFKKNIKINKKILKKFKMPQNENFPENFEKLQKIEYFFKKFKFPKI